MDFLGHPKAMTRLWACLMSDYEVVISNFLRSSGWTFSHFAEQAKKMDITLVYHCAVGKGKRRQEQYDEVVQVILETSKDFWLSADKPKYGEPYSPTEPVKNVNVFPPVNVKVEMNPEPEPEIEPEAAAESETEEDCWVQQPMTHVPVYFDKLLVGDDDEDFTEFAETPGHVLEAIGGRSTTSVMDDINVELVELGSDDEGEIIREVKVEPMHEVKVEPTHQEPKVEPQPEPNMEVETQQTPTTSRLTSSELVMVKRQLGGFYLTYLLYFKQPYEGLHRIMIDPEDHEAIKRLERKIQFLTPKIREQYDFMIFRMKLNHGFDIVAFADRYGLDHSTRTYLNSKKNEMVKLIKEDKDIQDKLSQCQDVQTGQKKYQRYFEQKRLVLNESLMSVLSNTCPTQVPTDFPDDSRAICELVPNLRSTEGVGQMVEAASKIKVLGQQPLFTHANLLGNESVDRIFIKEACKRIKRMQVKQEKGKIVNKKTKNPYVREGGIFGRKKDLEEGEKEMRRKKERAQTSGNLWNYINGVEFNRGRPPIPSTSASAATAAPIPNEAAKPGDEQPVNVAIGNTGTEIASTSAGVVFVATDTVGTETAPISANAYIPVISAANESETASAPTKPVNAPVTKNANHEPRSSRRTRLSVAAEAKLLKMAGQVD